MCKRSVYVSIWLRENVSWVIYCAYEVASISCCLVVSRIARDLSSVLWMCSRIPRPSPQYLVDTVWMLRVSDDRWGGFWSFYRKTRYPISEYQWICVYIWSCVWMCVYIEVNLWDLRLIAKIALKCHPVGHMG